MCGHEIKLCSRCQAGFECKPGNITQCECYTVTLTDEIRAYIEARYPDCLCAACLRYLSVEVHYFRERYIFR